MYHHYLSLGLLLMGLKDCGRMLVLLLGLLNPLGRLLTSVRIEM